MVKPATKPEVSDEELTYRRGMFPEISSIKNKNVLCTSCNKSVKELMLRGKCKAHPFLDTLLCEKCFEFFGDGEFSVDEDGSDKYCRWCGQGGTLFLCSNCTAGFCKKCIKRNLPRRALNEVEDDDWKCYCCEVKPLYELRAFCWAAKNYFEEKGDGENLKKRKMKEESSSEHEEEEEVNQDTKRRRNTQRIENKMNVEHKKEIRVASKKLCDFLLDASKLMEVAKKKSEEYKSKKSNMKSIKTIDDVQTFSEKIDAMLEIVENTSHKIRGNLKEYMKNWKQIIDENNRSKENSEEEDEKTEKTNNSSDKILDKSRDDKEKNESYEGSVTLKCEEEATNNGEEKSPNADDEEKSEDDADKPEADKGKGDKSPEKDRDKTTEEDDANAGPMDTSEPSEESTTVKDDNKDGDND